MQLVLDTNGLNLKVRNKSFLVSRQKESRIISPNKVTSIAVTADIVFSSAAVKLAVAHGIPIFFFDRTGKVRAKIWSQEFGSLANLRRKQVFFCETKAATAWIISLFQLKTERQVANLKYLADRKPKLKVEIKTTIETMQKEAALLSSYSDQLPITCSNSLMGKEGALAAKYWGMVSKCLPSNLAFDKRSRRPALDIFNAALNYLYGMTYSVTERAVSAAGLDPYFGVLHTDQYRNQTFVFDMIEPFRPWVDRLLLEICFKEKIDERFFDEKEEGFYLSKKGKAFFIPKYNENLLAVRQSNHRRTTTLNHYLIFAGEFAKKLKEMTFEI